MKRSSFTLAELIVVISIIAFLIAILVPVLQSSRQQSKSLLCSSNIKQLILGLLMYETENHRLPYGFYSDPKDTDPPSPPGGYLGRSYNRQGWWWLDFIEEFYVRSDMKRSIVQCPRKYLTDSKLNSDILCGNYGINRSICKSSADSEDDHKKEFIGVPLKSANIPDPSKTLLIVDSGYAMISWWYATDTPPFILNNKIIEDTAYVPGLWINKKRNLWLGQEQDAIYGRHPQKTVNIGFVDSHVNRTKANDLFVEKTEDGYKNKAPLWTPE